MKRFSLYDSYTTWGVLGGLALMHLLVLWISYHFFLRFQNDHDPGWIMLIFAFSLMPGFVDFLLRNEIPRFFMRCSFDSDGIHCSGTRWGRYIIPWDSIRTYGVYGTSYSYISMEMIFFSMDGLELGPKSPKEALQISRERLVFQVRQDLDAAVYSHMPSDMKKNLQYVLGRKQSGFFKR